jgi:regulator of sirC expression with transglutaminase-like and TPR domain
MTPVDAIAIDTYRNDPDRDELTAALLVATLLSPSLDVARVRQMLGELHDRFVRAGSQPSDVAALVAFLRDEGFKMTDDPSSLDASRIDEVLTSRRGIPITLAIPYLMVGRAAGLTTQGINFPGHFLLSANGVLIDPANAVQLTLADIDQRLADAGLEHLRATALTPATADEMAVRMLNNVKAIHAARGDLVAALALIDCQLPLVADSGSLQIERAELWFALGNAAAAIAILEEAQRRLAGTAWVAEIEKRLKRLRGRPPATVH